MHILISFAIHSFIHICIILQIFESTFQLSTNRGAPCVQIAHASGAPCIPMKFANLSIREILMITWPFVCRSIRTTGKPMWNAKLSEPVCLTWWSTDSYQNKLDNSPGHETNVCVQMDAPETHLCTFSEKFNIFHCYILYTTTVYIIAFTIIFCLNFVMGRWLTNCTSIICSLLFFYVNHPPIWSQSNQWGPARVNSDKRHDPKRSNSA